MGQGNRKLVLYRAVRAYNEKKKETMAETLMKRLRAAELKEAAATTRLGNVLALSDLLENDWKDHVESLTNSHTFSGISQLLPPGQAEVTAYFALFRTRETMVQATPSFRAKLNKQMDKLLVIIRETIPSFVLPADPHERQEIIDSVDILRQRFERIKKDTCVNAIRSNIRAYHLTKYKLYQSGHIGTKLGKRYEESLRK
ncbi:hypothetical protein BD770DRAFT_394461 [Pilaira anomala]|nr:hypothetical protein BD770DRAFT_394461 [Pilaira anomala]